MLEAIKLGIFLGAAIALIDGLLFDEKRRRKQRDAHELWEKATR